MEKQEVGIEVRSVPVSSNSRKPINKQKFKANLKLPRVDSYHHVNRLDVYFKTGGQVDRLHHLRLHPTQP